VSCSALRYTNGKAGGKSSGGTDERKTARGSAGIFVKLNKDLEKRVGNQDNVRKKDSRAKVVDILMDTISKL